MKKPSILRRRYIKGTSISINNDILCREKGAVSPDYVCKGHRYMPLPKALKNMDFRCADCMYFNLEPDNPKDRPYIGQCQLFTVRRYDGSQKSACSKFVMKPELEVS